MNHNSETLNQLDNIKARLAALVCLLTGLQEAASETAIDGACQFVHDIENIVENVTSNLQKT